jgi:carboxyl-terminal processing protease
VIDLPSFYGGEEGGRSSYGDMKRLLEEAARKKVDGVVVDLSRNGGGLLQDAVRISGLFIKEGGVVATKDSSGRVEVLADEDDSVVYDGPLVLLISPASASASEILAGALKDYRRAVVVGSEASFGKGTVQSLSPLPNGLGALKVTTGMFFLPKGASTQQRGVAADVTVPSIMASWDIGERKLDYALPAQTTAPFVSTSANGSAPGERWAPLDEALVARLAAQSKARVAGDPAMKEIVAEVAENRAKPAAVRLADLRKKAEKAKAATDEDAKKKFEAQGEAFVAEGVSIAADLAAALGARGSQAKR